MTSPSDSYDFDDLVATLVNIPATDPDPTGTEWQRAVGQYALRLGREPTTTEAAALLYDYLSQKRRESIAALQARDTFDPAQALDPFAFVEARSRVLPLWGIGDERPYWASGEAMVIFGGDGTHKSTLSQGLGLRLANAWPDPHLLGVEVAPVEGPVLLLALDRPAQIARSMGRFTSQLDGEYRHRAEDRLVIWPGSVPASVTHDPDGLARFLDDLAAHLGRPRWGAVILDNVSDAYGNLADTDQATLAGQALNRVANSGIEVVALHHPRKRDDRRRPETIDDIYGGRMFTKATGAVVGLYRGDTADDALVTVTHLKSPLGFRPAALVVPNLATGELRRVVEALGPSDEAQDEARVREVAQALGRFTVPTVAAETFGEGGRTKLGMANREKARRILDSIPETHQTSEREDRAQVWEWRP